MINLNKKIIAFDLDGTLALSKQPLTLEMAATIFPLVKEKKVAIISGGSFEQFKKQFLPNFIPAPGDFEDIYGNLILLPTSGSKRYQYSFSLKDWIITDIEKMQDDIKEKALKILKDYVATGKYGIGALVKGDEVVEDRLTQITMSALGQHASIANKKVWDPDQKKRLKIKKELEPLLPELEINIGGTTSLDFLAKGFNKAKGLLRLLDTLEMKKEDMLFVGDAIFPGGNDYSPYEEGIDCEKVSGPEDAKKLIKSWMK